MGASAAGPKHTSKYKYIEMTTDKVSRKIDGHKGKLAGRSGVSSHLNTTVLDVNSDRNAPEGQGTSGRF